MEVDIGSLKASKVLGRGATGTVFLITSTTRHRACPPLPFALKVVDVDVDVDEDGDRDVTRRARWEMTVLSLLSHPFLPTLLARDVSSSPRYISYALPFCHGGDLNSLRHSQPDRIFSITSLRFYAAEILSALSHLHRLRLVYRDLKPENVLVQLSGHLTLSDFDLSLHLPSESSNPQIPASSTSFVGTEEYVAPEVVKGEDHGFAVDWWALGVVTYEMAYGRTPFKGRNRRETFMNVVVQKLDFPGKRRMASDLTDLISRLLEKDPLRRLGSNGGAEEVMRHVFFRGVRWDLLAEMARPPFIPPVWESLEEDKGFDVREYLRKEKEKTRKKKETMSEVESPESSSSTTSVSLTE